MRTTCPHCNFEYQDVDNSLLGKDVKCTNCGEIFIAEEPIFDRQIDIKQKNRTVSTNIVKKNKNIAPMRKGFAVYFFRITAVLFFLYGITGIIYLCTLKDSDKLFDKLPFFLMILIISGCFYGFSRLIYLLEYACNRLYDILQK